MTKDHKLRGLKQQKYSHTVLLARSPKSRLRQGHAPSGGPGGFFLSPSYVLVALGDLRRPSAGSCVTPVPATARVVSPRTCLRAALLPPPDQRPPSVPDAHLRSVTYLHLQKACFPVRPHHRPETGMTLGGHHSAHGTWLGTPGQTVGAWPRSAGGNRAGMAPQCLLRAKPWRGHVMGAVVPKEPSHCHRMTGQEGWGSFTPTLPPPITHTQQKSRDRGAWGQWPWGPASWPQSRTREAATVWGSGC